jgi:uncharacterized protein YdaU (DUF1376 family)
MNYYSHHIGDYLSATAHLSLLEHGVYRRLIDVYYIHEAPLPAEVKQVYRLVGAKSKDEREAVDTVLEEFFTKIEAGWSQSRCDFEIGKCAEGQSGREERTANEAARVKRHREERAELFDKLRAVGVHAPWNIGVEALRKLATETSTQPLPVTAPVTPATASQSPNHPITQLPAFSISETAAAATEPPSTEKQENPPPPQALEIARAKILAGRLMRLEVDRGKSGRVSGSDPRVLSWASAGLTDPQFREAYDMALSRRDADRDQTPINAGFLDLFVAELLNPKGADGAVTAKAKPWHQTAPGIEAKGKELGVPPPDPLSGGFPAFKARVFEAAGVGIGAAA